MLVALTYEEMDICHKIEEEVHFFVSWAISVLDPHRGKDYSFSMNILHLGGDVNCWRLWAKVYMPEPVEYDPQVIMTLSYIDSATPFEISTSIVIDLIEKIKSELWIKMRQGQSFP